jgi:hypothetical protein
MTDTHKNHYVSCDWGVGYMYMRPASFRACTAAKFSTHQDSPRMDFESACYWYQFASKEGMVFL